MPVTSSAGRGEPGASESPVFILTASRSGSTLLRFILDSHPDLACPPETSIASVCAGLARTWDILLSAGSGSGRLVHEPTPLPADAAGAVREAIDRVYGRYLEGRGKRRWVDKSLDSFQHAELITQVYPHAKFICLYRHCMDVIASGVEVCPWGLHRFGFDPYVAQYPGNNVAAIGSYWLSVGQATHGFEEKHPELCHRVRYEDLVTAPEDTAAALFSFLGVPQAPGIAEACFRTPHEGEGPGDEKIWFTTGITPASMGRGVSVPVGGLMPPIREQINELLSKLDYRPIDEEWNAAPGPIDPRAGQQARPPMPAAGDRTEFTTAITALDHRIGAVTAADLQEATDRWPAIAGATVAIVIQSPDGSHQERLLTFSPGPAADPAANGGQQARSHPVASATANGQHEADGGREPVATIIAEASRWSALLNGSANIISEITAGRLRCVNRRDGHRIRSDEIHAVATLLGMARIPMARTAATLPAPEGRADKLPAPAG